MKKAFLIVFLCGVFFLGMQALAPSAHAACYRADYDTCQRIARGDGGQQPYCQSNSSFSYVQSCKEDPPLDCPGIPPCGPPRQAVTLCTPEPQGFCGAPAPVVTISLGSPTILLGQSTSLTWVTANATACTASGAWSGSEATNGVISVSPTSTGSYTYTLTCTGPGGSGNNEVTLQVNPPSSNGVINVTSENSQQKTKYVTAFWNFAGSVVDPCSGNYYNCYGATSTYKNQPAGNVNDSYTLNAGNPPAGYAFHSIERKTEIAEGPGTNPIVAFFEGLFNKAKAMVVCGFLNGNGQSCNGQGFPFSLALVNPGDVGNFIILWDPLATLSVNPTTVNLTDGNPATVNVRNTGSAGSIMTWTSTVNYRGGRTGWLTVTPAVDGTGVAAGSADPVVFKAVIVGLPKGTYYATTTILGSSLPCSLAPCPATGSPMNISIKLTVSGGGATPVVSIVSQPPQSAAVPVQIYCSGGVPPYAWTSDGSGYVFSNGGTSGDSQVITVTYATPNNYTITCTDTKGNGASAPLEIQPPCSLSAVPPAIVPPASSTLNWNCSPGIAVDNSCSITNGVGNNLPTTGSAMVTPTKDTSYTLSCVANNGLGSQIPPATVTVSIQSPNQVEIPPGSNHL